MWIFIRKSLYTIYKKSKKIQKCAESEKFSDFDLFKKDQVLNKGYAEQSKLRECPKAKATISEEKDSGSEEFIEIVKKFSINSVKGIIPKNRISTTNSW